VHKEKIRPIKAGCRINDAIFSKVVAHAMAGKFATERDIAKFINAQIRKAGARNAFPPIVAIGKNAVDWHHKPTGARLAEGGFCVIDFGARVNRYCSDMTRTIYFGKASAKEKRIYSLVRRANEKSILKVKAKSDGNDIYKYSRRLLGGYARYFGHGLGHGLGKIIHARPRLSRKKGRLLQEGDVVTIEPGVYIPKNFGIRIEDDVLVTKKGHKLLSHSTKELIEIQTVEFGIRR